MLLHVIREGGEGQHLSQREDRQPKTCVNGNVLDFILFGDPVITHLQLFFRRIFDAPTLLVESLVGDTQRPFTENLGGDLRRVEPVENPYTIFWILGRPGYDKNPRPTFASEATPAWPLWRWPGNQHSFWLN